MSTVAHPRFTGRIGVYLAEMYPLPVYVPVAALGFFGLDFLFQALHGVPHLVIGWHGLAGAATLVAFSLLMRLFDEFKDHEADLTLFPDRPLPSGRVTLADLRALALGLVAGMTALNAFGGPMLAGYLAMLAYGLLTWRYFFVPKLHAGNLLLTVATHNPSTVVCNLYVWTACLAERGLPLAWPTGPDWVAIAVGWLPVLAWEFARKVRAPEQETVYITYSKIFGPHVAALIPLGLLTTCAGMAVWLGPRCGLPWPSYAAIAAGWLVVATGVLRFLARPVAANARLKPLVEAYSAAQVLALVGGLLWRYGASWGG